MVKTSTGCLWLALLLGGAAQAATCPDLAGTFNCANQDGSTAVVELKVHQVEGQTRFWVGGTELVADNQSRPLPDDADIRSAVARAGCEDGEPPKLRFELSGSSYQDGIYVGRLHLVSTVSLTGDRLEYVTEGELRLGQTRVPLGSVQTCQKLH